MEPGKVIVSEGVPLLFGLGRTQPTMIVREDDWQRLTAQDSDNG